MHIFVGGSYSHFKTCSCCCEILEDPAVVCPSGSALSQGGDESEMYPPSALSLLRPLHLFLALPCQVGALDGLGSYAKEMKG